MNDVDAKLRRKRIAMARWRRRYAELCGFYVRDGEDSRFYLGRAGQAFEPFGEGFPTAYAALEHAYFLTLGDDRHTQRRERLHAG